MGGHPNFKCHSVSHHDVWEQFIPFFEGSWKKLVFLIVNLANLYLIGNLVGFGVYVAGVV